MVWLWVVLGLLVLAGIVFAVSYNRFVRGRQQIRNAWANIDTELRRRYDLIPNLVETVRGYAAHERGTFEAVTQARAAAASATGSPAAQAAAEGPLVAALRQLFAVAEAYPELKANQNFLALQAELSNTEDRLQGARRFYNAQVQDFNRRVHAFPSSIVANMFRFKDVEFFEVEEAMRPTMEQAPRVDFSGAGGPAPAPASGPAPAPAPGPAPASAGPDPTPPPSPPAPAPPPPSPPPPGEGTAGPSA
jgi:LemA protein